MYKMQRSGFTLIEIVFVLVISSVLAAGTFKALEALYIRSAKAKAVTELSLQSQIVLDQISVLLYNRIPNSVIGYNGNNNCVSIDEALTNTHSILEWLSLDDEQLLSGRYSGFVDLNASLGNKISTATPILAALGVSAADLNITNRNLIFAGAFDSGNEDMKSCSGAYGWHGNNSNLALAINSVPNNNQIRLTDDPAEIYEKYYLTNGAYAVARGADINLNANCITNLNQTVDANTLFLFYNYYPYQTLGDTYCADRAGVTTGNVSILAQDVTGFRASYENDIIRLAIDINQTIRGSSSVRISKQKAVF